MCGCPCRFLCCTARALQNTIHMKNKLALIASFLPLVILMGIGYIVPIASNIYMSTLDETGQFVGFDNYARTITSYYFLDSLLFTLKIAFISTALAMIIAIVVALALRQTFIGKKLTVFCFQVNLTVPRMAAAMMMMLLLSQTGFISQITHALGLTDSAGAFPLIMRDAGGVGIIIAFVWKFFPYIGMSVLGILQGASLELEEQAAVLGVGKFKRFFHITLPLIMPATCIATIIVFAAAFGDYEIPAVLGGSAHRSLSVFTYMQYSNPDLLDKPASYVLMVIMPIVLGVIIVLYWRLVNRGKIPAEKRFGGHLSHFEGVSSHGPKFDSTPSQAGSSTRQSARLCTKQTPSTNGEVE